jgi:carboxypeptidase C (cathepsin A)
MAQQLGLLLLLLAPLTATAAPVVALPGWHRPLPSKQDAGHITVDDVAGTSYFYWYVEATDVPPETAPLLVWYSGGPGGSGMIGMWTEAGPFTLDDENHPVRNTLAFTRRHNVIYLEQPCGVGFSYSNSSAAYSMDDDDSARLNYVFLQRWLAAFPALQGRQLWLAGESYAGMYIPRLVEQIVAGPDAMLRGSLRGVLLGNPHIWCDSLPKEDEQSHFAFVTSWFYHGLVPMTLYAEWTAAGCNDSEGSGTKACEALYRIVRKAAGIGSNIEEENLRRDHCAGNGSIAGSIEHSEDRSLCPRTTNVGPIYGYTAYLGTAAVQQAAHVESPMPRYPGGRDPRFHYSRSNVSVILTWRQIFKTLPGLKVLIYSGTEDIATNPSFLTQTCLHELRDDRGSTGKNWSSWKVNNWHAGYVEYFERYAFATVQGAGHRVPENQPLAAVTMYERFIGSGSLDTPSLVA